MQDMRMWGEGGTRGSDVLRMRVVLGMKGVGGVCEMCMCLAQGGV